ALQFTEADWIQTLHTTLLMDELVRKHSEVMDKHDPDKKIGLYVDEWGAWYDVEPGTNPGFLFQQNTMRDAIIAGLNLNVFQAHADRVKMANIAQMINVLQAMILTDKEKMLLTPTYHVFEMYQPFQNSTLLPSDLTTPDYQLGEVNIPMVSVSAARAGDGSLVVALVNADPNKGATVATKFTGASPRKATGRLLTAPAMNTHNTFDQPAAVQSAAFNGARRKGEVWSFELPAKSVVVVTLN
ncbi:MAG TPA: alpha-L-arabinofuranosidase C-terminal domain-containing protein, partial [Steroidobacteraceae bacterium]|nr:alpha-L-arabinofuranosidase C-terminal domain-containing protein [Steroidobacteraceae bacterium]